MNGQIYYFTGTGNSYAIAKDLSDELSCNLNAINDITIKQTINTNTGLFGIIFPVYHATYGRSGIPNIVNTFPKNISDLSGNTIFVICTHSGIPGYTIENVNKIIEEKNGKLSIGLTIKMSSPFSTFRKIAHIITKKKLVTDNDFELKKREKLYTNWGKLKIHVLNLLKSNISEVEKISFIKKIFLKYLLVSQKAMILKRYQYLSKSGKTDMEELFRQSDNNFQTTNECIKCGTCSKICPVSNITIEDKPRWHNKCELCFACYQWCPKQAITGEIFEYEKRFHHPAISLTDMINRNKT